MSDGLNRQCILGYVGADPELRYAGETPVLSVRIAVTSSWLDAAKVKQERTEWFSVEVWGNRGKALAGIITNGSMLYVEGETRTRTWEKDGAKHYKTEVHATDVKLCGTRGVTGGGQSSEREAPSPQASGGAPKPRQPANRGKPAAKHDPILDEDPYANNG